MLKNVLISVTAVAMLFGFLSCRMLPEDSDIGEFLKTDLAGHFLETKTYITYSSTEWNYSTYLDTRITEIFASDGEYTRTVMIYEDYSEDIDGDYIYGEGYMPWAEYTGTYTYSSIFLTLEKSYTTNETYYMDQDGYYTYRTTPNEYTYGRNDRKYSYYFTENNYGSAFKANLGKWTYTYEYKSDDDSYKYESDISYILNTLSFKARNFDSEVEMPLIFNLAWEWEMDIDLDEPVITFLAGETKEFEGEIDSERERDFWDEDYFEEWDDDPYERVGDSFSTSLTNYGDFIAY